MPLHMNLIRAIYATNMHIICTVRSKMAYEQAKDDSGKPSIKKLGMEPVQQPGAEYEFDMVMAMEENHAGIVSKSRCTAVDGAVVVKPDAEWFQTVIDWLNDGAEPAVAPGRRAHVNRSE